MSKLFLLLVFGCLFFSASSQVGEWTWVHGTSAPNNSGNMGAIGVPSPSNVPPALYEACEWKGANGVFWLYGGKDISGNYHNDLWKYDPATNQWTWMKGTNTINAAGVYGTQGIPAANNRPSARGMGSATWVDINGNFWMFGGSAGSGCFNDLWKYDVGTNQWAWMKGANTLNQTGTYGTMGVPAALNKPGARWETAAAWTDDAGDLWLFGGINLSGAGFNDLWRYNIASNNWTWMKGSSLTNQTGVYGTKGVEASANNPGARLVYSRWKDKSGNLWLFGGWDYTNNITFNDLWRYNPVTNNWTWMTGSNTSNAAGVYGTKCVTAPANTPGRRFENRLAWTDQNGNFWMLGGGYGEEFSDTWNDLWMYCVSNNQWTWEGGQSTSNPVGSWGTAGVSSPTNRPNGRAGAVGWISDAGILYFFGGSTTTYPTLYNDLWKFVIDPACGTCSVIIPPVASFKSDDSTICTYECINFTDLSTNATSWQWTFTGGTPASSTDQNPQNICYMASGNYNVRLIASNGNSTDTLTFTNYSTVFPLPITPIITQLNDTLLYFPTDPSYVSYQWYFNSVLIPGETDTTLVALQNGNYNVQVIDSNGCSIAVGINIILGFNSFAASDLLFSLTPNPAGDELNIAGDWRQESGNWSLVIFNMLGERVYMREISRKTVLNSAHGMNEKIDCTAFPPGVYIIQVNNEKKNWLGRFVKK